MPQSSQNQLIIVSNRLPVTVSDKNGTIVYKPSVGGLATGLSSLLRAHKSTWIGWCGLESDNLSDDTFEEVSKTLINTYNCRSIFLSKKNIEYYYEGFCNNTIWPLFHYFSHYVEYGDELWEEYVEVNNMFCDEIVKIAKPGDTIWIQDYHLMLLPSMIKERLPKANVGFFLHIPFPSFEIFRQLPERKELLNGLLGADLIGYHTYDYARHFISSVHRILGHDYNMNHLYLPDRVIRVDVFPMGIEYDKYADAGVTPQVKKEVNSLKKEFNGRKVIVSIDRMDYTKGIPQRLEAYNNFLKKYPEYKEKVVLIVLAVPSREEVQSYKEIKSQVDELVGQINGEHGTLGWVPVWMLYRSLPFDKLMALYEIADICLITPLRDGMNLVAKEFVASKSDGKGVLILSDMAGAARELGEALIVNPTNNAEIVDALHVGMQMPSREQVERMRAMQWRVKRYNVQRWAEEFVDRLNDIKIMQKEMSAKILTVNAKEQLVRKYKNSKKRLIFLDYDGTFVSFYKHPQLARPGGKTLNLLEQLCRDEKNEVVLITGRTKDNMDDWFGSIGISMVAEHGMWVKRKGHEWVKSASMGNEWKDEIRPVMEINVDRTPGTFIEEKEYSLVWHYRNAESDYSVIRARELIDRLVGLTHNHKLQVLEGKKVIEVKNTGVSKGRAATKWISKGKWDFIMGIGDDRTDEDMFQVLPDKSYSIKVGLFPSIAKYNLETHEDVISLLESLF